MYELEPAHFLLVPGLPWQACLKKTKIELELLTDTDMLLMVEKDIRGGICHAIHRCGTISNKYMKNYDKDKEPSYIIYLDENNMDGWKMSQKLNGFKWEKNTSKFNENLIKFMMNIVI